MGLKESVGTSNATSQQCPATDSPTAISQESPIGLPITLCQESPVGLPNVPCQESSVSFLPTSSQECPVGFSSSPCTVDLPTALFQPWPRCLPITRCQETSLDLPTLPCQENSIALPPTSSQECNESFLPSSCTGELPSTPSPCPIGLPITPCQKSSVGLPTAPCQENSVALPSTYSQECPVGLPPSAIALEITTAPSQEFRVGLVPSPCEESTLGSPTASSQECPGRLTSSLCQEFTTDSPITPSQECPDDLPPSPCQECTVQTPTASSQEFSVDLSTAPCSPSCIEIETTISTPDARKMLPDKFSADAWLKFRLLMWKNYLQQWRRRGQTMAELLLPVLTMTLVLIIRWAVPPSHEDISNYPALRAYSMDLSMAVVAGMDSKVINIAYSPKSPILQDIITTALAALVEENPRFRRYLYGRVKKRQANDRKPRRSEISELYSLTVKAYLRDATYIHAYNSSKELRSLYAEEKTTRIVFAAVEFDDELFGATTLPNGNISYSLRFPERPRMNSFYQNGGRSWRTDLIFPGYELPGPRFPYSWEGGWDPGYVKELFIALQQAMSIELITRMTGQNIRAMFTVFIQRYPYPAYWQDKSLTVMKFLFPMFIMLSCSYTAINIVRAIVVEKELQLKETMKIMGLPTWLHWAAWFWKQFLFQLLIAILMVILLKVHWFSTEEGFSNYAVFTYTPWTVLMFFLLLYLTSIIFFCFMLSGFFSNGSSAALFTGIIWFLTFMPSIALTSDVELSMAAQIVSCLIINTAMAFGFQLLLAKESAGGMQWGQFMSSPATESPRLVFGHVVFMLLLDCILYMLITLYLEQISPGPFGAPRPWYFPFQRKFWYPDRSDSTPRRTPRSPPRSTPRDSFGVAQQINKQHKPPPFRICFRSIVYAYEAAVNVMPKNTVPSEVKDHIIVQEKDPLNHTIGVKIQNLTKVFGHQSVVNNLNLNIYNDQITVLLGHNGAGKSTTISMLTGNIEPTHGTITVAGYDMGTQAATARSQIGLCPQYNVLFDELTVKEHLEFFSRLKGFTGTELQADIETLINKLELEAKRDYPSHGLSGGQKRRLCVGIALSGGAKVVLLDEPTSGMDPASRRGLWDLLQREKKGRSMILTTHFMDEADILGDRVAIMAQGRLQCVGSPFFLKRHYGVGYTLIFVKGNNFDTERCTTLINKYIPGTVVKEDSGSEVTYNLPNEFSHKFEDMLNDLEHNVQTINFQSYGLATTTLEDVFMSVGADLAPVDTNKKSGKADAHEIDLSLKQFDQPKSSVTGHTLLIQRVVVVWLKLVLVSSRSWWLVVLQFVVPVILLNVALGMLQYVLLLVPTINKRMLTLAKEYAQTESLLCCDGSSTPSALAAKTYEDMFKASVMKLTSIGNYPMEDYYLNRTKDPLVRASLRHQILIGSTFTKESVTAWFSNFGYHDVAVSLAAVHSALLKSFNRDSDLIVYNHPLEATYADQTDMQMMITMISMQLSTGIGSGLAIMTAVNIIFYIKERVSGAKLLQKSAGLQPVVMWGSAAVFDWVWFLMFCVPIPISFAIFNVAGLSTMPELARLYVCLMVYGAAIIPLTYILSHLFNGPAFGFVCYFFINVLLGMLGSQIVESLMAPDLNTRAAADAMDNVLQFHPLYSLVTAVRSLNQIGLHQQRCFQMCEYYQVLYPDFVCKMEALCELDTTCCTPPNSQFRWAEPGVLRYLVAMITTGVFFWALLMFIEYRLMKKIWSPKKRSPPVDKNTLDEDVVAEAKHAHEVYKSNLANQALLALNLSKYYGNYLAVNQISFCVNDGECFGLLGVNGAGKTTTFKMLMGDESMSSGEAFVSGHSVEKSLHKVHENIGYCPQFDALFMELTGRETIRMFALMRGLRLRFVKPITESFAHALGFHIHLDKRVYQYSGGTRRKLNTAVAFLGRTRLVFVDEPTTGVDPAARRHVWRAMRGVQRAGRGVVLTSHSMEECEALCTRLTIMVNGRFQCFGTPQHLKIKFSEGYTLTIKVKTDENGNPGLTSISHIKNYINLNFKNPRIMEEYQGQLTYYLPDRSIAWSRMFGIMERSKQECDIEDYTISQTTLEQIFLQFTKYQGYEQTTEVEKSEKVSDPLQKLSEPTEKTSSPLEENLSVKDTSISTPKTASPVSRISSKQILDPIQNGSEPSQKTSDPIKITSSTKFLDLMQNKSEPAQRTANLIQRTFPKNFQIQCKIHLRKLLTLFKEYLQQRFQILGKIFRNLRKNLYSWFRSESKKTSNPLEGTFPSKTSSNSVQDSSISTQKTENPIARTASMQYLDPIQNTSEPSLKNSNPVQLTEPALKA